MIPLTPKMTVLMSIQRISETVSACWAGVKPGARSVLTRSGAITAATSASAVMMMSTRFVTALNSRHAPRRSRRVRQPVKTGMKAEPSAPPATN